VLRERATTVCYLLLASCASPLARTDAGPARDSGFTRDSGSTADANIWEPPTMVGPTPCLGGVSDAGRLTGTWSHAAPYAGESPGPLDFIDSSPCGAELYRETFEFRFGRLLAAAVVM
jgi:hypothetical protein